MMKNISVKILLISLCAYNMSCKRTWVCYCDSSKLQLHRPMAVTGFTKHQAVKTCKAFETNSVSIGYTPDTDGCYIVE